MTYEEQCNTCQSCHSQTPNAAAGNTYTCVRCELPVHFVPHFCCYFQLNEKADTFQIICMDCTEDTA